jgi:hypothetical protein
MGARGRFCCERLRPAWERNVVEAKAKDGRPWGVDGLEDHLLVLLILYCCHLTQDVLGCLYGVNKSAISRSNGRIERIAAKVLGMSRRILVSAAEAQALISVLHGEGRGKEGHSSAIGQVMRTEFGRPRSSIRLNATRRPVATAATAPGMRIKRDERRQSQEVRCVLDRTDSCPTEPRTPGASLRPRLWAAPRARPCPRRLASWGGTVA